jgi:sugar O-acyltransferase (sialic acid O-acetyltransferase NeuD family)
MHDLIIIGAGKFGREILNWTLDAIQAGQGWRVKGFLDDRRDALQGFNYDVPILGPAETYAPRENDRFLCAIGAPEIRRKYSDLVLAKGGRFETLVHPSACVGRNVDLAPGVMIAPGAILTADLQIETGSYIGAQTVCSHDNRIGPWCQVSGNAGLAGGVVLEESCFVGMGAMLLPGVRIGKAAYVGAGSVVLKSVRPGARVFGSPARPFLEPEGKSD